MHCASAGAAGIGWSATVFDLPNLSVQTSYQPDTNEDRHLSLCDLQRVCVDSWLVKQTAMPRQAADQYYSSAFARHKAGRWGKGIRKAQCRPTLQAWPCWLRTQQCWHGTLAPKASCNRRASKVSHYIPLKEAGTQLRTSSTGFMTTAEPPSAWKH